MNNRLFDLVQQGSRQRKKLHRILILQAPIIFVLLVFIKQVPFSTHLIIDSLLLLGFYWLYLKIKQLTGIAELIDLYMFEDVAAEKSNFEKRYISWTTYYKKGSAVTKPSTIVAIIVLIVALYKPQLRILLSFVIVIDCVIFFLARSTSIKNYALNTANFWVGNAQVQDEGPRNPVAIGKAFFVGYFVGLIYLAVTYYVMAMTPLSYLLYYFIVSNLVALNLVSTFLSQYLSSIIKIIDS